MVFLHLKGLEMDQLGPKMDQTGLKLVFFVTIIPFFAEIVFAKHSL